jgi:hypothetical protein
MRSAAKPIFLPVARATPNPIRRSIKEADFKSVVLLSIWSATVNDQTTLAGGCIVSGISRYHSGYSELRHQLSRMNGALIRRAMPIDILTTWTDTSTVWTTNCACEDALITLQLHER